MILSLQIKLWHYACCFLFKLHCADSVINLFKCFLSKSLLFYLHASNRLLIWFSKTLLDKRMLWLLLLSNKVRYRRIRHKRFSSSWLPGRLKSSNFSVIHTGSCVWTDSNLKDFSCNYSITVQMFRCETTHPECKENTRS